MKLFIEIKSFALPASGEGDVLIDADILFHRTGFPYLSARRIKGLFRESMIETLEISGFKNDDINHIINVLFGKSGEDDIKGKLQFSNAWLLNWEKISAAVDKDTALSNPSSIKEFFTTEISQTAINEYGTAEERSLRTYRVIKPIKDITVFESYIRVEPIEIKITDKIISGHGIIALLEKAAFNLRFMGTRRNRGFGRIRCWIAEGEKGSANDTAGIVSGDCLPVSIKTLSQVVLSRQFGDQNTVATDLAISGNRLRGVLIDRFLTNKPLSEPGNAELFKKLFLNGNLQFSSLRIDGADSCPLNIHYRKGEGKDGTLLNVFQARDENSRALRGIGIYDGDGQWQKKKVKTSFVFHNSRMKNRLAGRNRSNDEGGIFYYESIDEGQVFEGTIKGEETYLKELASNTGFHFFAGMGRSKSAQYGEVEVNIGIPVSKNNQFPTGKGGEFLLICRSPLVLFNQYGVAEPSMRNLQKYLNSAGVEGKIVKVAAEFTIAEQYNVQWRSKSDKTPCFAEGSVFLIETTWPVSAMAVITKGFGEWTDQGFGSMYVVDHTSFPAEFSSRSGEKKNGKGQTVPDTLKDESKYQDIPVLDQLGKHLNWQEKIINTKSIALEQVVKKDNRSPLSNHLIGRMISMIKEAKDYGTIEHYIAELKNKQAFRELQKARIINRSDVFEFKIPENNSLFQLDRIYWLTYFQALRKIKKQ